MKILSKLFLFSLVAVSSQTVQPQVKIDVLQARASYDFRYKDYTKQSNYAKSDLMFLDIGKRVSKFYSRNQQIRDSLMNDGLKKNLSPGEIVEIQRGYKKGNKFVIYQIFDNKQIIETNQFINGFLCEESMGMPKWDIRKDDNKTILGYACQKAVASLGGREWEVYFTPEIPLNKGPWKLWGLPGLIVYAKDSEDLFLFELKGFETKSDDAAIILVNTESKGKEYQKVDKKTYKSHEKLCKEDFFTFSSVVLGMDLKNSEGVTPKIPKWDYIPLEK